MSNKFNLLCHAFFHYGFQRIEKKCVYRERERGENKREEWRRRDGERKMEMKNHESGSCVQQPAKCGQPVMIVRA